MVLFACFLLSISTAFEFQLEEYRNECKSEAVTATIAEEVFQAGNNVTALKSLERGDSSNLNGGESRLQPSFDNDVFSTRINSMNDSSNYPKLHHKTSYNPTDVDHYVNDAERDNASTSRVIPKGNHNTCSSVSDFYCHL